MATARFGIAVVGAVGTVAGVGIGIALALNVGVMVAVRVGVGVAVAVVVAVGIAAKERPEMSPADDLLSDIAAVCRGEMPPEPREGGSDAQHAAWVAVCALRVEVERLRGEVSYLRACVPPVHPSDYGHEVWTETVRTAVEAERAAVVAWLRYEAEMRTGTNTAAAFRVSEGLSGAAADIESGEHRHEETK